MTKITQTNFAKPPMSWLRKMSLKTAISNQIQMMNRKNQSIDRKTWPVPNSFASISGYSYPWELDGGQHTWRSRDPHRPSVGSRRVATRGANGHPIEGARS